MPKTCYCENRRCTCTPAIRRAIERIIDDAQEFHHEVDRIIGRADWMRGYAMMARTFGTLAKKTTASSVMRTLRSLAQYPPVNDFQRGMADALLDSVGC